MQNIRYIFIFSANFSHLLPLWVYIILFQLACSKTLSSDNIFLQLDCSSFPHERFGRSFYIAILRRWSHYLSSFVLDTISNISPERTPFLLLWGEAKFTLGFQKYLSYEFIINFLILIIYISNYIHWKYILYHIHICIHGNLLRRQLVAIYGLEPENLDGSFIDLPSLVLKMENVTLVISLKLHAKENTYCIHLIWISGTLKFLEAWLTRAICSMYTQNGWLDDTYNSIINR